MSEWVCEFCHGSSGCPRQNGEDSNSRCCTASQCKEDLKAARLREKEARRAAGGSGESNTAGIRLPKNCYEVKDVYGHRYISPADLSPLEQRIGRDTDDEDVCYLVLGRFGDVKRDDYVAGTCWVKLSHLIEHCDEEELDSQLEDYEKGLHKAMKAVRRRLR